MMYNPPSWNDHSLSGTRQCMWSFNKWCVPSASNVFLSKNDNSGGKTREASEGVEYDFCPVWSRVLIFYPLSNQINLCMVINIWGIIKFGICQIEMTNRIELDNNWTYRYYGVLDTTLCDKVCQWSATGRWFSPVSYTNKTDRQDITEILLKVALNTINQTINLL
jgi:hypothetical protein